MASPPLDSHGAWYLLRARRYAIAGVGPIALAGTNFSVSFAMLRLEAPGDFGVFTFLFVAAQFTIALSAALFGAPLQALPATSRGGPADGTRAIVSATALAAVLAGLGFLSLARSMGLPFVPAGCYALYTGAMILRWVGRAWCYATDRPLRTAASDLIYAAVTLGTFAVAAGWLRIDPDNACYAALATGASVSLASFGRGYIAMLFAGSFRTFWTVYREIWRTQSRWALLGVGTTEAAANAHVYLVTLLASGEAMAPIAAASLLMRPINVAQNALADAERPQMARLIAAGAATELRRTTRLFLGVLLAVWLAAAALAWVIVHYFPAVAFSQGYDLGTVRLAIVLWTIVSFLILLQVPLNVMLQAGGEFRALAAATLCSSIVNVVGVALALAFFGPVWSVAAMTLGWTVDLLLVRRAAMRMQRARGLA